MDKEEIKLPEHLKKLCDIYGWEYSRIKIEDGVPRCCDTCKFAREDGYIQRVNCMLDDIYVHRVSRCKDYEQKAQN